MHFSIACLHILLNATDQFVSNIFMMRGSSHQILRDIGLILPDVLHVILPVIEYRRENVDFIISSNSNSKETKEKIKTTDYLTCLVIVTCLWYVGTNL